MNPAGRGTTGAAPAPAREGHGSADDDQRLVARVREGDDRAFEVLYQRYHRRIHAYVLGMVADHGRAEDVTQEIFVSALRRMRETAEALAFRPWLYQIAKNACIDAFRRSRRAEEVSYDAAEALAPADQTKLVSAGPSPDAAVAAKQDLADLCGAFGGLSDTHHEILVLRELEGLSYQEIARRMGMTRPAVESTLFRARRRLSEEYGEIVSGARCRRIQDIIAVAAESSRLGARDTRRLARHLSHCQSCRREALAAGLDRELFVRRPLRERLAERIAGLLPFGLLRRGAEAPPPSGGGARGASLAAQLPTLSDQLAGGWAKAAAGAAMLVAGVGAGVGVQHASRPAPERPSATARAATGPATDQAARTAPVKPGRPTAATASAAAGAASEPAARGAAKRERRKRAGADRLRSEWDTPSARSERRRSDSGTDSPAAPERKAAGGDAPAKPPAAATDASRSKSERSRPRKPSGESKPSSTATPAPTADPVQRTGDAVNTTVQQTGEVLNTTVQQTGNTVNKVVGDVTGVVDKTVEGTGAVGQTVQQVTSTVNQIVNTTTQGLNQTTSGLTGTLNGILGAGG